MFWEFERGEGVLEVGELILLTRWASSWVGGWMDGWIGIGAALDTLALPAYLHMWP